MAANKAIPKFQTFSFVLFLPKCYTCLPIFFVNYFFFPLLQSFQMKPHVLTFTVTDAVLSLTADLGQNPLLLLQIDSV
jgi:hypothetical protein